MEADNIDQLFDLGINLGKMHRIGAQSEFQHRENLDLQTMLSTPIQTLQKSELIPKFIQAPLFTTLETIEQKLKVQYKPTSKIIRLHGDCHPSNILINESMPYFVDFDDCKMGPAVQDLWMLLSGDHKDKILQLSMLLEGYQEEYEFDNQELALIEPLRTMRIINYVSWINKRWSDPTFPMNFPWFTTDQYWKELLQSLRQQIIAIDETPLTLQSFY